MGKFREISVTALSAILVFTASAAGAQTVSSIGSANPLPEPETKPKSDLDKTVCEKVHRTGSRLAIEKVCMSAQQWADHKAGHRHDLEKVQQVVNQNPSK